MEVGKWVIYDSKYLLLSRDNSYYIPSAQEIFMVEFKNVQNINGMCVRKPSEQLPYLKLSKFPLDTYIQVTSNEQANIVATVLLGNSQISTVLENFEPKSPDHIIVNNTWYPVTPGAFSNINDLIEKLGISNLSNLTLRQYSYLRRIDNILLKDELSTVPLNKGSLFEDTDVRIPGFTAQLYPYQCLGFRWLKMISDQDAGCILADEMGLGKTIQIIALLTSEKERSHAPSLVVSPSTLLENWRREVTRFSPALKVLIHQGHQRTGYFHYLLDYDVVITSYDTIVRDISLFEMIDWNIVVTDEAQAIKNPLAKRTNAVKQIRRRASIAVTGTPVENRLLDLWSVTDFAFPGFLGDKRQFESTFPEEMEGAASLEPLISPIMLRRRVVDVAKDLPDRIDIPQVLRLQDREIEEYEKIREDILCEYGQQASLVALSKLRIFCTHPLIYRHETGDPTTFGKYLRLIEILEEIVSNGDKVLVFTSFREMIDLMLKDLCNRLNVYCDFIDGRVPVNERQPRIDAFSWVQGAAIMILNPKAAGVGLNVTAANHVIHYNLEWNPALEDQASARAYRRGQMRPVSIHRIYLADTVEEVMNDRVTNKRLLSDAAVIGTDGNDDGTDILNALMKSPRGGEHRT